MLQQPHFHLGSHVTQVTCCCFSPDGSTILSGSLDHTLKLWRTCDGSLINTLHGHTDYVTTTSLHGHTKPVTTTSLSSWFSCHTGLLLLFLT